jgi:uncharacterized protein (TIGR02453 family)
MFNGFPKESIAFLQEIEANNNKLWFEANKSRFETLIKEPSKAFVIEMGEHIQALVPTINAEPKVNGSLFRIYRDVRFSKDKTPIKTRIGLIFWQGRKKRLKSSSFYMHFNKKELFIATGIRWFDRPTLLAFREWIKDDKKRAELFKILEDLQAKGYDVVQPHYKRFPKGFNKEMQYVELALFDALFASLSVDVKKYLFSEKLIDKCYEVYEDMLDHHEWVYELTLRVDDTGP